MTELFIDGVPVSLSKDFSIDYTIENPFFTRAGAYTYDIDIDLRDAHNRKLYQMIDRDDIHRVPIKRKAVLQCDGTTIVDGTEIVLSVDNHIAKIQIVSGNSELNYISRDKQSIRDIDFGELAVTPESAMRSTTGEYPEFNYVCTPVIYEKEGKLSMLNEIVAKEKTFAFVPGTTFAPQPYLLYVIETLLSKLGYTVIGNTLALDARWRKVFLVNAINTVRINEMLPDWTVNEFLSEVEKLFNCTFSVNQFDKTVSILKNSAFYSNRNTEYIDDVVDDEFQKEYDCEQSLAAVYDSVSYDLPQSKEYKYMCLDPAVRAKCSLEEVTNYWDNWESVKNDYDKLIIRRDTTRGLDFVRYDYGMKYISLKPIDQFAEVVTRESQNVTTLKIVPAEQYAQKGIYHLNDKDTDTEMTGAYLAVFARNANPTADEYDAEAKLSELIKDGVPQVKAPDRLFVALYGGVREMLMMSTKEPSKVLVGTAVPWSMVDNIGYIVAKEKVSEVGDIWVDSLMEINDANLTLRLKGWDGLAAIYYNTTIKVDTSTEYVFSFISKKIPDQRSIFVIRNNRYYCRQINVSINASGRENIITGVFYKVED